MSLSALAGLTAVQARVAQIESQFTVPTPGGASATATGGTASDFADVLSRSIAGGSATAPGSGTPTGNAAVATAERYLGVPYVYGGTDPANGLDCSGLVQLVYRQLGVDLPRTTYEQVKVGTPVDPADLQPGDLVFSVGDRAHVANGHVGIYAGNGMYVVAPHTGDVVKLAPVPKDVTAVRRVTGGPARRAESGAR
ncbi:MAG TPA: C40 family peptidase [Acidimicrobiia bacterium]|nr:C40 family peptidase [Acidimicrobiia bacterium]